MTLRFARALAGALALGTAAAAVGCGGGSGPLVTTTSGGREDPGSTRDTPPSARDNPTSDCIECDVEYRCTTPGNRNVPTSIGLSSSNGTCTQASINLVCSGALFGQNACAGGGGGPFTCGQTTCTPVSPQPQPGPSQGNGTIGVDAG
jgi:hypothetical protein